jgi:transcriptional regulator with XRE-family HTH domain
MLALKALREKCALSQTDLGALAGTSQIAIWFIEKGTTRKPRVGTLVKLAAALGVHPSFLMRETEELTPDERKELGL